MKIMKNSDNIHMEKMYEEENTDSFATLPMDSEMQDECTYVPPMVDTETMPIEENYGQTMDSERMGAAKPWKPKGHK